MDATEKGMTLFEVLKARLRRDKEETTKPPELKTFNPLEAPVGTFVEIEIPHPELLGKNFKVVEIDVYRRRVGGKKLEFADYILDDGEEHTVTLRVFPTENTDPDAPKHCEALVLFPHRNFEYDPVLHKEILPLGVLEVRDNEGKEVVATYTRPSGVTQHYSAEVTIMRGDNKTEIEHFDYWDFVRATPDGTADYYFVEMSQNSHDRGMFQTYHGVPVHEADIKVFRPKIGQKEE